MSKPSWDNAPEWAEWLAMDTGGSWYWHSREPFFDDADGCWYDRDIDDELFTLAGDSLGDIDARCTLEARP